MKPCKHPCCPDSGPCRKATAPKWRAKPRPMSDKRSREMAQYRKERIAYLKEHPQCEARLWCCIGRATEIHHKQGRENDLLNDQSKWLAICPSCHRYITDNSHEAIELGLSISKHKKSILMKQIISKQDEENARYADAGELLPCPFCGRNPLSYGIRNEKTQNVVYKISCPNMECNANTFACMGTDPEESRNAAVKRWNNRI